MEKDIIMTNITIELRRKIVRECMKLMQEMNKEKQEKKKIIIRGVTL